MSKSVIVQFVKPWQGYATGEKAGFDKDKAEALQKAGFATIGGKGASKAAKPEAKPEAAPVKDEPVAKPADDAKP